MKLKEITDRIDCEIIGGTAAEIEDISYDSRNIKKVGVLFAAIPGEHVDGHAFIKAAADNGAAAVLAQRPTEGIGIPQVIVKDIRAALSRMSDIFYGEPSASLVMVGVTGTNGKTTTTYLLESIFREAGFNPGVIGTINYRYNGSIFAAPHTTPQSPELHKILKEMLEAGVTHCIMEVSSHSLEQKRVEDVRFRAGVFTNLTHDHLDYHRTMEEYFRCKSILFRHLKESGGKSVINMDDEWGRILKKDFPLSTTFSLRQGADIYPEEYALLQGTTEAIISVPTGAVKVSSNLVGEYNLHNILSAVGISYSLGIGNEAIGRGISALKSVPGRLEKIESTGPKVIRAYVDYAHTEDALQRALEALNRIAKGRIITVFGCGGNRDRLKRPKMGAVSARLSDITIVTSDNPRDEEPLEIIKEIQAGIKVEKLSDGSEGKKGYLVIPDRTEAIRKAVNIAGNGDTILVAGKGHEDYQIIKGRKYHFDDFEVLNEAIKELCPPKDAAGAV